MSIETPEDLAALKRVGGVVRETLATLEAHTRPGITTFELERLAKRVFDKHGARSAPVLEYNAPATVFISLNDEAVHGPPGGRIIRPGDVVKLDVTPELGGYIADAAITVLVPPVAPILKRLCHCSSRTLRKAMRLARAGVATRELGRLIEREVSRQGFSVLRDLAGHGVGRAVHEEPSLFNFAHPSDRGVLREGMVITIEPIIAVGRGSSYLAPDGWTVRTRDGGAVAHFEHTLVVQRGEPIILTA